MKLYTIFLILIYIFVFEPANAEERLSQKDYQKLIDLGYNKIDAYADDYSKTKAYWYTLEEHLKLKPKYLALMNQPMIVNKKEIVNKHIYNSKHHFFASRKEKCKKKKGAKSLNFLKKCTVLKMPIIDDSLVSLEDFAKISLDHCNETKVKNLFTRDGEELTITNIKNCEIKFINFKRYEFTKVLKEVSSGSSKKKQSENKKNNFEFFKKQCEDLGFIPKTEKFGNCVLRLAEIKNKF